LNNKVYSSTQQRPNREGREPGILTAERQAASDRKHSQIVFLLGAISFFYVQSGGQLYAIEFIFATFLLFYHPQERPKMLRWVGAALLLWGLGSVLSDLANQSEFLDGAKGIARVVFLAIDVYALFYLCRNRISVIYALWGGLATAGTLAFFIQPDVSARTEPWKFGVGVAFTVLVVLLASNSRLRGPWPVALIIALAGVHFVLGFRSMSSILLIVAMVLLVRVSSRRVEMGLTRGVRIRPLVILVTGITAMVVLTELYDGLARSGTFGQIAAAKASYQSDGQFGSLFSSRSEILLSAQSIAENPLLGGGSFSVATSQVTESAAEIMSRYGYADIAHRLSEGAPAYHSEILGSWAENGVLVLIFWIPMAILFLRALIGVVYREVAMPYLVAFVSVTGLWDILFSPFGADRRVWVAASLTTVIAAFVNAPAHRRRPLASDLDPHNQLQPSRVPAEVHRLGRQPGVR
jgi:hypothetical protein